MAVTLPYHIKTNDFYADIRNDVNKWFVTSELPVGWWPVWNACGCEQEGAGDDERRNKRKNNKRGCCSESEIIFIKMYEEGKENKKCKGIVKAVIKNAISHKDYKKCLFSKENQYIQLYFTV